MAGEIAVWTRPPKAVEGVENLPCRNHAREGRIFANWRAALLNCARQRPGTQRTPGGGSPPASLMKRSPQSDWAGWISTVTTSTLAVPIAPGAGKEAKL